jgi:hypothetical protein
MRDARCLIDIKVTPWSREAKSMGQFLPSGPSQDFAETGWSLRKSGGEKCPCMLNTLRLSAPCALTSTYFNKNLIQFCAGKEVRDFSCCRVFGV